MCCRSLATVEALRQGRSMMDFLGEETARLNRALSKDDQSRLDQYLTSVRELEQRMQSSEAWEQKPKPVVTAKPTLPSLASISTNRSPPPT